MSPGARALNGALLWEDRYDANSFEQAFAVATLSDTAFVAGYVGTPTGRNFVVRAYDAATGRLAWQDHADKGRDDFASGVVTDSKRVFVSGNSFRTGTDYDWVLRAYDADTGRLLWENMFDHVGRRDFSRGTAIAAGDGLVFLGGYGTNAQDVGNFNTDYVVRAHDAASGALRWQDQIIGFSGAYSMTFEGGRLYVGGWTGTGQSERAIVRAYDVRSGMLLWERSTPAAPPLGFSFTKTVRVHGARVFAAQSLSATAGLFPITFLIQAFDKDTGDLLWKTDFRPGVQQSLLNDIDVFGGRVFAVGQGGPDCGDSPETPSNCDAIIRAYDEANGNLHWERRLDLSGGDDDATLVSAGSGKLFVHAQAYSTHFLSGVGLVGQWVMQAFDLAGRLLWQDVAGEVESGVYNMAVGNGRLIIPGRSVDRNTGDWDLIVRAYDIGGRRSEIEPLFSAPRNFLLTGPSGTVSYEISSDTPLTTAVLGASPAEEQRGMVVDDPANDFFSALATRNGVTLHRVSIPAGTRQFRVALFDADTDGADDLDLYLFSPTGRLIASSASFTATERIDLSNPPAGTYTAVVHGYETDGPDANYTLFAWSLGETPVGNLIVSGPTPQTPPAGVITVSWSGLTPGRRYLGLISYSDGTNVKGQTVLSIAP